MPHHNQLIKTLLRAEADPTLGDDARKSDAWRAALSEAQEYGLRYVQKREMGLSPTETWERHTRRRAAATLCL